MGSRLGARMRTLSALGISNLIRVGTYRLGLKLGLHPVLRIQHVAPHGPFFDTVQESVVANAQRRHLAPLNRWQTTGQWFSAHEFPLVDQLPPNWFANPFRKGTIGNSEKPWFELSDFDPELGDIKTVWEASRFDWLLAMSSRAAFGDTAELARMNAWLGDWVVSNRPYHGLNWKCGQEASIRVIHLATAALMLGQEKQSNQNLLDLVFMHLKRIAPTMEYAIGQSNNHGTSEAAALFIGGSWLRAFGMKSGKKWEQKGRYWLLNRARKLISDDGSFSQYSVNYHRMVLDTFAIAETWRRNLGLSPFHEDIIERLALATNWMDSLVDKVTGDAPNIGANDGAEIVKLSNNRYRDFRSSLQRASLLFRGKRAVAETGPWDDASRWLDIDVTQPLSDPQASRTFDDGGYHLLRTAEAKVVLRYPRFKFRPSHADALHIDLWVNGHSLLRDGGTYSYAANEADVSYFSGVASHNTIQFDERDQMPRLGRFLYGDWLKTTKMQKVQTGEDNVSAFAEYVDAAGATHKRDVLLDAQTLTVTDNIDGFTNSAVIRWRLAPGDYRIENNKIIGKDLRIEIICDVPLMRIQLTDGYESHTYLAKSQLPVLEVEVCQPCAIETRFEF